AFKLGNVDGAQSPGSQTKAECIRIRSNVVANVVVGPAEPETCALAARIRQRPAIAAARCEISRPFNTHCEVVFKHVETLGTVLGNNSGSASFVNHVIAYQTVMAVVNRDSPLRSSVN